MFGNEAYDSLGQTDLTLYMPTGSPTIFIPVDVVVTGVLAVLGLSDMFSHSLTPEIVTNRLVKRTVVKGDKGTASGYAVDDWNVPLHLPGGHIFTQT